MGIPVPAAAGSEGAECPPQTVSYTQARLAHRLAGGIDRASSPDSLDDLNLLPSCSCRLTPVGLTEGIYRSSRSDTLDDVHLPPLRFRYDTLDRPVGLARGIRRSAMPDTLARDSGSVLVSGEAAWYRHDAGNRHYCHNPDYHCALASHDLLLLSLCSSADHSACLSAR